MNKRQFLKIAGSTGIILAAGSAGFMATRTPKTALLPWKVDASLYTDPMRRALSYAILAPNPHNRQPWLVSLMNGAEATLSCDLDRLLPATDPFSRQIVIGLGCFLELFSIAAAEQGFRAVIEYFPKGESLDALDRRPIAKLSLVKEKENKGDLLFSQVLKRRTNRNPYDMTRPIAASLLKRVAGVTGGAVKVGTSNHEQQLEMLRELTRDAMTVEFHTPEAYRESIDLMRIGRREIDANPDGISLSGAMLEALNLAGLLTRESLVDPTSQAFQSGVDMFDDAAMSSMGFVWINTEGNGRSDQIEAGRAYMRLALQATAEGLSMQPMSQALQEYDTMVPHYRKIHDMLTEQSSERVQMLARLGYADKVDPAPRWPLASRIEQV